MSDFVIYIERVSVLETHGQPNGGFFLYTVVNSFNCFFYIFVICSTDMAPEISSVILGLYGCQHDTVNLAAG